MSLKNHQTHCLQAPNTDFIRAPHQSLLSAISPPGPPHNLHPRFTSQHTDNLNDTRQHNIRHRFTTYTPSLALSVSTPPFNSLKPGALRRLMLSRAASLRAKLTKPQTQSSSTIPTFTTPPLLLSNRPMNFPY